LKRNGECFTLRKRESVTWDLSKCMILSDTFLTISPSRWIWEEWKFCFVFYANFVSKTKKRKCYKWIISQFVSHFVLLWVSSRFWFSRDKKQKFWQSCCC
jgi:hypothetical protein